MANPKVLKLGDRVQTINRQMEGRISYIGNTSFSPGMWYGITLDKPTGKHNGTILGTSYFKCKKNCGLFVRRSNLNFKPKTSKKKTSQQPLNLFPAVGKEAFNDSISNIMRTANLMDFKLEAIKKELQTEKLKEEVESFKKKYENAQKELLEEKLKNQEQQKMLIQTEKQIKVQEKIRDFVKELKCQLKWTKIDYRELEKSKELIDTENIVLTETTEHAIIEKELAEDSLERNLAELEDTKMRILELEVHLGHMKTQNEVLCQERKPIRSYVRRLEKQNENLKYAIYFMCSVLSSADAKRMKLENELSLKINLNFTLQNELATYKECIREGEERIKELVDTVDALNSSDKILHEVIHRNQVLENQIAEHQNAVIVLEKDVETLENSKKNLNKRIKSQEKELQDRSFELHSFQEKVSSKQAIIQDQNDTLQKFRKQVQAFTFENENLKDMLEQVSAKLKEIPQHASTQNANFENKNLKDKFLLNSIRMEKLEIEVDTANMQLQYWSKFLPGTFFSYGGEDEAIQMMLLVQKLLRNTYLMSSIIKQKFPEGEGTAFSNDVDDTVVIDKFSFRNKLCIKVLSLQIALYELREFLDKCEIRELLNLGTLYLDTKLKTNILEAQITDLCMEQTNEKTNSLCSGLEKVISYFRSILEYCSIHGDIRSLATIKTFVKLVQTASEFLSFELSLLERIATNISNKILQTGVRGCVALVLDISNEINKLQKCMPLGKNLNILLKENAGGKVRKIIERVEISLETTFCARNEIKLHEFGLGDTGCQLYYPSPMYTLKLNLKILTEKLREFSILLNEHLTIDFDHNKRPLTIITRAKEYQHNQNSLLNNLKYQLDCYGKQINTLQRVLKSKDKTINQFQINKQTLEKKLRKTTQISEDQLSENFKNEAASQTKQIAIDYQLQDMVRKIRFLQWNNEELRSRRVYLQLSTLPPLKFPPVMSKESTEHRVINNLRHRILFLKSQAQDLLLPTVVDIHKGNAYNSYKRCISDRKYKTLRIAQEIEVVKLKILQFKAVCEGKSVVGDFKTYPVPQETKTTKTSNMLSVVRVPTNENWDYITSMGKEFRQIKGIFQILK